MVSLGFGADGKRVRRKVSGKTKTDVADALRVLHEELSRGLHTSRTYTVRQAVSDWLDSGLPGRSERTRSVYRQATAPLLEQIGAKALRDLSAGDVRAGLEAMAGRVSTRYLQIARGSLVRAKEIALLVGHKQTAMTELVYRHDLRPVIRTGAVVMDRLFDSAATAP